MKRVWLIVWLIVVALISAAVGNRSALAQNCTGCGTTCMCGCGYNNRGLQYWYSCSAPCQWCGGGADDACETDHCGGNCGTGCQDFCIYWPLCGQPGYEGCFGLKCI